MYNRSVKASITSTVSVLVITLSYMVRKDNGMTETKDTYEDAASEKIKSLVLENAPPSKVFFLIQDLIEGWAKKKLYTVEFKLDMSDDYKVTVKFATAKPKNWSTEYVRDFLNNLCVYLSSGQILLYSFCLRHDRPALVEVGDLPTSRKHAYNFIKPNKKFEDVENG